MQTLVGGKSASFAWPTLRVLGLLIGAALLGCGGGSSMSASDMRKYAIKRPSDDEDSASSKASVATPAVNAANRAAPSPPDPAGGRAGVQSAAPTSKGGAAASPGAAAAAPDVSENATTDPRSPGPNPASDDGESTSRSDVAANDGAAEQVAEPAEPPADEPLTHEARLAKSAENMEAISAALLMYLENENVVPPAAAYDAAGTPLLSWRVLILPYLGYQELYEQFKVNEPWYTPHNKQLVDKIPAVFQSPERHDTATNYLAVVGGSAAFDPKRRNGVHPRRFEDGFENTVLVVEADDEAAITWTQPDEYKFDPVEPTAQLGNLRGGHFFVI